MKNLFSLFIFLIVAFAIGCSKNEDDAPSAKELLEKDPSVDESFGLKINLGSYGLPKFAGNAWGSPSQFFISAEKDVLKVDLIANSLSNIAPNSGGLVTGLSGEKSIMIFVGDVNNKYGYYGYSIPAPDTAIPLVSLNNNEATSLLVYGNHFLLGTGVLVTIGRPCTSIGDFWCGVSQATENYTLYHVDAVTKVSTVIGPDHHPVLFSEDGQKALISGNGKLYEYDLNLLRKTDSVLNTGRRPFSWVKTDFQTLQIDTNGDIVITDSDTGTEIDRFQPSVMLTSVLWGPTGRKICYTGACRTNDCTYSLWSFDLDSRQEKRHVLTRDTTPLTSPFEEILVSPDGQNLVFRHVNSLYLKEL